MKSKDLERYIEELETKVASLEEENSILREVSVGEEKHVSLTKDIMLSHDKFIKWVEKNPQELKNCYTRRLLRGEFDIFKLIDFCNLHFNNVYFKKGIIFLIKSKDFFHVEPRLALNSKKYFDLFLDQEFSDNETISVIFSKNFSERYQNFRKKFKVKETFVEYFFLQERNNNRNVIESGLNVDLLLLTPHSECLVPNKNAFTRGMSPVVYSMFLLFKKSFILTPLSLLMLLILFVFNLIGLDILSLLDYNVRSVMLDCFVGMFFGGIFLPLASATIFSAILHVKKQMGLMDFKEDKKIEFKKLEE